MRRRSTASVLAVTLALHLGASLAGAEPRKKATGWEPQGLSGGGAMFAPAISPVQPKRMLVNCDMSAAYVSRDGRHTWAMVHHAQLGGNTRCRPAWHPREADVVYAAHGWEGRLRVGRKAAATIRDLGDHGNLRGEIAVDPERPALLPAESGNEVWRSSDAGACRGRSTPTPASIRRTKPPPCAPRMADEAGGRPLDRGGCRAVSLHGRW